MTQPDEQQVGFSFYIKDGKHNNITEEGRNNLAWQSSPACSRSASVLVLPCGWETIWKTTQGAMFVQMYSYKIIWVLFYI